MREITTEQQRWIKDKIAKMTVKEKMKQITCVSLSSIVWSGYAREDLSFEDYKKNIDHALKKYPIGNVFCGAEIIHEAKEGADVTHEVLQYIQEKSEIPILVSGDIEYGVGAAVTGMTKFPNIMTLAALGDEQAAYDMGRVVAREARAIGFNWVFGPVLDLCESWITCGHGREISDDPDIVIKFGSAFIRGLNDNGVAACGKHFPDGGGDYRNPHIALTENGKSKEEWFASTGRIYKELIENGMTSVMAGHTALKWAEEYDEKNCGYCPASLSKNAVQKVLRNMLGFDGVVVTDSVGMAGCATWENIKQRTIDIFNAGEDVLLFPDDKYYVALEEAIVTGAIPEERVDESVERVLRLKFKLGLFEKNDEYGKMAEIKEEAEKMSRFLSKHAITCVRNKLNLLPLSKEKTKKVLILRLDKCSENTRATAFIEALQNMGIETEIYDVRDFEDWNVKPKLLEREAEGACWDAYFWLYEYSFIGDYRPGGLIAQTLMRAASFEALSPILISFSSPYILEDIPDAKTFVTTFSSNNKKEIVEALVKALFGEEEFNYNLPVSHLRKRVK